MRSIAFLALLAASGGPAHAANYDCKSASVPAGLRWNPPDSLVSSELRRFYRMDGEIKAALANKAYDIVAALAHEYLELASRFPCNWNFGNAIHDAHSALGLVELGRGDQPAAVRMLLAASKSPGSPQLDSFGPGMRLADELLSRGERAAISAYLRGVQSFWKMDDGELARWIGILERGGRPNLSMQLR